MPQAPTNVVSLAAAGGLSLELPAQGLHMHLALFEDAVVAVHYEGGVPVRAAEVEPAALVRALGALPCGTGLLPPGCLACGWQEGGMWLAVRVPAGRRTLRYDAGSEQWQGTVPLPALVFWGWGTAYRVWALASDAPEMLTGTEPLYRAPLSNVGGGGLICQGDAPFPLCTPQTVWQAVACFFASAFSSHLADGKCLSHPRAVQGAWQALAGAEAWPDAELVPTGMRLGDLVRRWEEGR